MLFYIFASRSTGTFKPVKQINAEKEALVPAMAYVAA